MRLRDAPFININSDKGLVGDYVRTLLPLDDRRVMVGTSRGLSIIEEGLAHSALMPQVGARPRYSVWPKQTSKVKKSGLGRYKKDCSFGKTASCVLC